MGCLSPSTVFPTREGYLVLQHFAPGREWGNHQLLSLPSEEGEGADSPLSASWCETGVYRNWGKCTNRLSNTVNLQPWEGKRSGRICSHQSFVTPFTTQEKLLGQIYIYTNHSTPLLFYCPVQIPLHCKEGSARPQFAMELDHPRRAQGTAQRCFSTLGCSIHILIDSCLFPELLAAVLSPSPTVSTSTEPEIPWIFATYKGRQRVISCSHYSSISPCSAVGCCRNSSKRPEYWTHIIKPVPPSCFQGLLWVALSIKSVP